MIEHIEGSCQCATVAMEPCGFCEDNGTIVWCRICRASATVTRPEEEGEMLQCERCDQIAPFCEWLDQPTPGRPFIIIQDEAAALLGGNRPRPMNETMERFVEEWVRWPEAPRQADKPALTDAIADLIDRPCHGPECRRTVPESSASEDFCSADCERGWRAANNGVKAGVFGESIIPAGHPAEATAQLPDHLPELDAARPSDNWPAALPEANTYRDVQAANRVSGATGLFQFLGSVHTEQPRPAYLIHRGLIRPMETLGGPAVEDAAEAMRLMARQVQDVYGIPAEFMPEPVEIRATRTPAEQFLDLVHGPPYGYSNAFGGQARNVVAQRVTRFESLIALARARVRLIGPWTVSVDPAVEDSHQLDPPS